MQRMEIDNQEHGRLQQLESFHENNYAGCMQDTDTMQ